MIPVTIGIMALVITVAMHAVATSIAVYLLANHGQWINQTFKTFSRPMILAFTAAFLAVKHYLDIILWAVAYWVFAKWDHFDEFTDALYFSSVTYTSLGYGDIVLTGKWRLLCGVQAINGVLLFGWSTALLFIIVQKLWIEDAQKTLDEKKSG